jgi:hypothetical protein
VPVHPARTSSRSAPLRGSIAPALSAIERSAFRELSQAQPAPDGGRHEHASTHAVATDEEGSPIPAFDFASAPDTLPMLDSSGRHSHRLDQLLYANPVFLRWSGHASLA